MLDPITISTLRLALVVFQNSLSFIHFALSFLFLYECVDSRVNELTQPMANSLASWARLRTPATSLVKARPYDIRTGFLAISTARGSSRSISSNVNDNTTKFQSANRLSGRTCMITGGTSGIGFAIAERFLQEGASSVILVGRSQERLQAAAARLHAPASTVADGKWSNGVATRAPEEDEHDPNGATNVSDTVRLLVGDVGEAGSWMRELEKEMVFPSDPTSSRIMLEDKVQSNNSPDRRRHPRQRSRHLYLQHPPQIRTSRYLQNSTHKS